VHALLHDRIMVANSVLWAALFAGALVVTHYPVLT
jgi:hypothetical protein